MQIEDTEDASTLSGISQAVLNGSGLRSNEFVEESIVKCYFISAMRYRYEHKIENTEFAVIIPCLTVILVIFCRFQNSNL